MNTRFRCSRCHKLVPEDQLYECKGAYRLKALTEPNAYVKRKLSERFHYAMHSHSAGAGRIGSRTWSEECGPVVREQVDDYVLQVEHLVGEEA